MFTLNKKEWQELITTCDNLPAAIRFSPALPYTFTEHGVTMLPSILKGRKAVQMNIAIIRAFVALKEFAFNYKELAGQVKELKQITGNHNSQLNQIYEALETLLDQRKWDGRQRIGFK